METKGAPKEELRPDELLRLVIAQAAALGIPVSRKISPAVRLNARAKKRFGCCIGSPAKGFVIELSAALPAAGRQACLQTLAHEVLHTCPGCQNHGSRWKAYAERMNAVQLPQTVPRYRWRIVCTGCGRQFYRQKSSALVRSPARYRCAVCGGRLRVEPLDPPLAALPQEAAPGAGPAQTTP